MRLTSASVSAVIIISLSVLTAPAQAEWGIIKQLTTSSENSLLTATGQSVAVMGSHVHVVYADRPGGVRSLMYLRSTDRGQSWGPTTTIEPRSLNQAYSVATDSSGGVHLINARQTGGLWYRRSTDNGASWLDAVELHDSLSLPLLLTGGSASVHVFGVHTDGALRTRTSTDGGATWGNWRPVATAAAYAGLSGGSAGSLIILAYAYGPQGAAQTYRVRSTDGGQTWSTPLQVSSTPQTVPLGIWTDGTNAWLSFTIFGAGRNFRRSTDGGASWQSEQTLRVYVQSLSFNGSNLGALGLIDDSHVMFIRSANSGAAWSDTTKICSFEPGPREYPRLAVDELGNAHAVWSSRQTGTMQIFYRFGGGVIGIEEESPASPRPAAARLTPNPARSFVRLAGAEPASLYNHAGARVAELRPGPNAINGLSRGVYFVRTATGEDAGKLVKLD